MLKKPKKKSYYQSKQKPKVDYHFVGLDPMDIENRLNRAFDILFEEVLKNREKDTHRSSLTAYDN